MVLAMELSALGLPGHANDRLHMSEGVVVPALGDRVGVVASVGREGQVVFAVAVAVAGAAASVLAFVCVVGGLVLDGEVLLVGSWQRRRSEFAHGELKAAATGVKGALCFFA